VIRDLGDLAGEDEILHSPYPMPGELDTENRFGDVSPIPRPKVGPGKRDLPLVRGEIEGRAIRDVSFDLSVDTRPEVL
jgi:hypothetical protein